MRTAYQIQVPRGGPSVVLAELTCSELLMAMKLAGTERSDVVRGLAVSREAVRMAIRQVDGVEVRSADLQGEGWKQHFPRTRHGFFLSRAWSHIHQPSEEEISSVVDGASVAVDDLVETWTVTLPDGREVVLAEADQETVGQALARAEREAKSPAAQEFLGVMEAGRRCIRSVAGQAVTAEDLEGRRWDKTFSVRETFLLARVWAEMHLDASWEAEDELGGMRPVPGGGQ